MRRGLLIALFLMISSVELMGCAKLMGNLRRDLDDSEPYSAPTVGGVWPEGGLLASEDYVVGHQERAPANDDYRRLAGADSWVNDESAEAARRDLHRARGEIEEAQDFASYSNSPSVPPSTRRAYKNGLRATRRDFVDDLPNEGSLWASDGQTNYYFTKNKIRGVGDIVTINMEADLVKDTSVEVRRTLTEKEREMEIALAQERLRNKALGLEAGGKDAVSTSKAAPARGPAGEKKDTKSEEDIEVPEATAADIDVSKSMDIKAGDTMLAEIIERYPNGNYKIRGTKKIRYQNSSRMLTLVGVVKGSDITEEDILNSGKLYEYRLEIIR